MTEICQKIVNPPIVRYAPRAGGTQRMRMTELRLKTVARADWLTV